MKKFFYRVNNGEDIFSISNKFNLCPYKVIFDNNLSCEVDSGDLLYIESDDYSLYMVKPFDTLDTISKKFNISINHLKEINGNIPFVFYGLNIIVN